MKHLGSRIGNPKYKEFNWQLLLYFDSGANDNLPISCKLLRKQSKSIANSLEIDSYKGSKGCIHRFLRRNDKVP